MARRSGGKIVTDGLVMALDAANPNSYPGTGTTWTDLSGNGNDGTLTNGPIFRGDLAGGCIQLDEVNDSINLEYDLRRDFSLECWAFYIRIQSFDDLVFFGQGTTTTSSGLAIEKTNGSNVKFGMRNNDTNFAGPASVDSITWQHWVFTYTHSSPYTKKAYYNGVELTGTPVQTQTQYSGTGTLRIGATYSSGGDYCSGRFGNVKIYDRVLTAEEVRQNFNVHRKRYGL